MSSDDLEIKVAVMEEKIQGVREQNKAQMEVIKESIDDLNARITILNTKMDEVIEYKNKSKGAVVVAGGLMGLVAGLLGKYI